MLRSWFRDHSSIGLLIDIGSGSTVTTLVESEPNTHTPHLIWSNREHHPLRAGATAEQLSKAIITSLINASLSINSHVLPALQAYRARARITDIQVTIAAPWSYTIPQTITYQQPKPIQVTKELLNELAIQADKKVAEDVRAQAAVAELGLTVVDRQTTAILCNGYAVTHPTEQQAETITFMQQSVIAQTYLTDAINDIHQKTLPGADIEITSTMLALFTTLRGLRSSATNVAIINLGYEATEIGIMRDANLVYTTHTPIGLYTLARQIAEQTDLPAGEIFGYFGTRQPLDAITHLSERKKSVVNATIGTYEQALLGLFLETGDGLILPPTLVLHCEAKYLPFVTPLFINAAHQATQGNHAVELFTSFISAHDLDNQPPDDGIAHATAQFFHMTQQKQSELI